MGWRERGVTDNGYNVSLWGEKDILKFVEVMAAQLCGYTKKY